MKLGTKKIFGGKKFYPTMACCGCSSTPYDFNEGVVECLKHFDKDKDGKLSLDEFKELCAKLFCNDVQVPYTLDKCEIDKVFRTFDRDQDGFIDGFEFCSCWANWIKTILNPKAVLIVVDVQNDFICGSLAIPGAEEIIGRINRLLRLPFSKIIYSQDWHPVDHISFIENLPLRKLIFPCCPMDVKIGDTVIFDGPINQTVWPKHCVKNTPGAAFHTDLNIVDNSWIILKGTDSEEDAYNAFLGRDKIDHRLLPEKLKEIAPTDVYICGLALDVCVRETAIGSISYDYRTIIVDNCSKGISPRHIDETYQEITSYHGIFVDSCSVKQMVSGKDRRPELGYFLANKCRS